MPTLKEEHKTFIIQEFARFKGPASVVRSVKENLDLDVSKQQAWSYSPANAKLLEKWRELHDQTRAQFIAETAGIGISHKSYRLSQLQEMLEAAVKMKNYGLAADLLEQAAKEEGGLFTNKRHLDFNPRDGLAALLGVETDDLPASPTGEVPEELVGKSSQKGKRTR